MKLRAYLRDNRIKIGAFAETIFVDRVSVSRYLAGGRPSSTIMERIQAATAGAVTPNDWFDAGGPDVHDDQSAIAGRAQS